MQLLELVQSGGGPLLELGLGTDHVQVATRTRIEGEGQAEVPAAGDVPVAQVSQPIIHPLAHVVRGPIHGGVGPKQPRPQVLDGDEPVVGDAEDEWRLAAPAVGIAVDDLLGRLQPASLGEVGHDLVGRLDGPQSV